MAGVGAPGGRRPTTVISGRVINSFGKTVIYAEKLLSMLERLNVSSVFGNFCGCLEESLFKQFLTICE
jgi:hypothetical protein